MELESDFDAQNTIFLRTSISFANNTFYDNSSLKSNGSQTISPPGKTYNAPHLHTKRTKYTII